VWVAVVPLGVMAILNIIYSILEQMKIYGGAGILVEIVVMLCWLALPGLAVFAALMWAKPRFSQFLVTLGFLIGFAVPLVISILPNHWWIGDKPPTSDSAEEGFRIITYLVKAFAGFYAYFLALPLVLAVAVGTLRAAGRLRILLPESSTPGIVLTSVAPIVSLLFIAIPFMFIHALIEYYALLFLAIILLAAAPLIYMIMAGTFIRPIATPGDRAAVNLWSWVSFGIGGAGAVCLIVFLIVSLPSSEEKKAALDERLAQIDFPKDFPDMPKMDKGGKPKGGSSSSSSSGPPKMPASIPFMLSLRLGIEFLGCALFATVWASQFLVWASVLAARSGQPLAQNAERRMAELEPVVGKI
jgi:hypothetical protein